VFVCSSAVIVEGAFVGDCRGLGVCTVGMVCLSVGGKCVGRRAKVVTGWGRQRRGGKDRGESR
jgi:hypothetical protein